MDSNPIPFTVTEPPESIAEVYVIGVSVPWKHIVSEAPTNPLQDEHK